MPTNAKGEAHYHHRLSCSFPEFCQTRRLTDELTHSTPHSLLTQIEPVIYKIYFVTAKGQGLVLQLLVCWFVGWGTPAAGSRYGTYGTVLCSPAKQYTSSWLLESSQDMPFLGSRGCYGIYTHAQVLDSNNNISTTKYLQWETGRATIVYSLTHNMYFKSYLRRP